MVKVGEKVAWDKDGVKGLRRHLGMTQEKLAEELGGRQQTVSEWERGLYRPRGTSAKLLSMIADRVGFQYRAGIPQSPR